MRNLVAVAGIKTGLHNGAETLEGIILEDLLNNLLLASLIQSVVSPVTRQAFRPMKYFGCCGDSSARTVSRNLPSSMPVPREQHVSDSPWEAEASTPSSPVIHQATSLPEYSRAPKLHEIDRHKEIGPHNQFDRTDQWIGHFKGEPVPDDLHWLSSSSSCESSTPENNKRTSGAVKDDSSEGDSESEAESDVDSESGLVELGSRFWSPENFPLPELDPQTNHLHRTNMAANLCTFSSQRMQELCNELLRQRGSPQSSSNLNRWTRG